MEILNNKPTRKKFLLWSTLLLGSATLFKWFSRGEKKQATDTVKLLSQDGKLVEIDRKLLVSTGKKASKTDLQQWIKK